MGHWISENTSGLTCNVLHLEAPVDAVCVTVSSRMDDLANAPDNGSKAIKVRDKIIIDGMECECQV